MRNEEIETVHRLLSIMNLSRQWPDLKPVHDAALADLKKYQNDVLGLAQPKTDTRVSGKDQNPPRMIPSNPEVKDPVTEPLPVVERH